MTSDDDSGLQVTLDEAEEPEDDLVRPRTIEGAPLETTEADRLLARLPALPETEELQEDFAFRDRSRPAPRAGETVETAFPPPEDRPAPATAEARSFEVLRFAPEGHVELAPKLSITFSKPVVAVTGQDDAAKTVPATIEPRVDGDWRWIGTRTALFEPTGERFPMATDYTVEVAESLTSATGEALDEALSFEFSTPPVELTRVYPTDGPHPRRPVMFMEFNQRVDAKELLEYVLVEADGEVFEIAPATDEQIRGDEQVRRLVERARPGQFIAFRTRQRLPAAATVRVGLREGAPSAEGPALTREPQSQDFQTYEPLRIERHGCNRGEQCPPGAGWFITTNNPLDEDSVSEEDIRVDPPLPNMEVRARHTSIHINGQSDPRTTYEVTVDQSLRDRFGQRLGEDPTLEFEVGPASPSLSSPAQLLSVLDPASDGRFPIYTVNIESVRVRAFEVSPTHWGEYLEFVRERSRDADAEPPGAAVLDEELDLDTEDDQLSETLVDLNDALDEDGHGQLVLMIEATDPTTDTGQRHHYGANEVVSWVQSTQIALDGFTTSEGLLAWTSALADGAPLAGVDVSLLEGDAAETDASGLAELELPGTSAGGELDYGNVLVAQDDGDVAILPERVAPYRSGASRWRKTSQKPEVLWHVLDDRGMYKPGETVHIKGWLRLLRNSREDRLAQSGAEQIRFAVFDPRGSRLVRGDAELSESGGFDFEIDLPDDVNLGHARVQIGVDGDQYHGTTSHSFQIQEFRRPEFEVDVSAPAGPHVVGQTATATAEAGYYAGGGLAGAPVEWTVQTRRGHYTPPNRDDYTFGEHIPWWIGAPNVETNSASFSGHTDAGGEHHLDIRFDSAEPPLASAVEASAAVTDVNRQTWSSSTNLLVHPADVYVGIRSEKNFVANDAPIEIDSIVTDIDGELVAGRPVEMTAVRLNWRYKKGKWQQVESDEEACTLTSSDGPETCTFEPQRGGTWRVRALTRDETGRPSMSQMQVWVAGGEMPPSRRVEQQEVELVPDRETYEAGDTAEVLVQAPFPDAHGLLTVRQNGLVAHQRFEVDGQSHTLEIPISEADYPNVHVQVDLAGADIYRDDAGDPRPEAGERPAFARGSLSLKVPPRRRALSVAVSPDKQEVAPGAETTIAVEVTRADGTPADDAEVAVIAVDEAILALTGYELRDPLDSFYPQQAPGVADHYLRRYLLLATADEAEEQLGRDGTGMALQQRAMESAPVTQAAPKRADEAADSGAQQAEPIAMRQDFRALALFAPSVRTDQDGKANVDVMLPDNLTRYRLMAVAAHQNDQFGKGESSLTARLPLMVRPSPPRFLNWGDRVELPIVVQNQTDETAEVNLAVRAANLRFGEPFGKRFEVPARDRVEVRFPAVTEETGEATLQVAASSGSWSDAAQNQLPVYTPATTEAFATYGTLDDGVLTQPVEAPTDAIEQFGGLEVSTSSTALQELTDALLYLVEYPYECSEQLASRVMGVAALKDVLEAFDTDGLPDEEELVAAVERDIDQLSRLQRPDGGFNLWSSGDRRYFPYVSVHVAHSLQRANMKGFSVPDRLLDGARKHLADIEQHLPNDYSEVTKTSIRAYASYVLDLMGAPAHDKTLDLAQKQPGEELSLEAIGWIMAALAGKSGVSSRVGELGRYVQNQVAETAATAQFTTSYGGQEHVLMHSSRRTDAILLDALIATAPDSDLIPKVVRGLLGHRTKGRWLNTQENVFVLVALDRYFRTYEEQTPDFIARMWLGDGYVGEHAYEGRTTDRKRVDIPMAALAEVADADSEPESTSLVLQKDGDGRLYYRIGMRYAPESLKLEAADYGFAVERRYEAVDDRDDVTRRGDGTWQIKAGARVRVVLTMAAPARRYHVALVDPLPAGLEPLNPELAVTEVIPERQNEAARHSDYWWWFRPWYSHQNLRDERAEAFASMVWAGVHEYSYTTRAITPGEFVVPPTKAEEMYHPETFGRTATDRVVVE